MLVIEVHMKEQYVEMVLLYSQGNQNGQEIERKMQLNFQMKAIQPKMQI